MKTAFLFAGQGSQYVSMGKDFYQNSPAAAKVFDSGDIDFDVKETCFEGPRETLNDTAYTQSCVFLTSMAIVRALEEKGVKAHCAAGLSLGEYSALCYSGAFDISDGLNIVRRRGQLMAGALPAGTSKMAAVMGCEVPVIQDACRQASRLGVCRIANYNCPGQIVISGEKAAVGKAGEILSAQPRARVIPLNVSGAFHTSLLADAAVKLGRTLDKYDIKKPELTVYFNTTGRREEVKDGRQLKEILCRQIQSSVYFQQIVENMVADGVQLFVEVGPGAALSKFVKKIDRNARVVSVDKFSDIEKVLEALKDE